MQRLTDHKQVASVIVSQLGNMTLRMLGARQLLALDEQCGGLAFKTGRTEAGRANYVKIVLTADDLYDVTFQRIHAKGVSEVAFHAGMYVDSLHDLIEKHTGMFTRL